MYINAIKIKEVYTQKIRPISPLLFSIFQLLDMKVFVDTDSDIRLIRRLKRDISQRGRDISGIIKQYNKFVKPAFEQYIEPTVQVADIVVPRGQCSPDITTLQISGFY